MCMCPKTIKVPNSNLGIFSPVQEYISVPCGKCMECRVSHAKEWAVRCMCEFYSRPVKEQDRSWFITLTYDDEHNPVIVNPKHVTKFIKSLRKKYKDLRIKYFFCSEYGTLSFRPHHHMIIYNLPIDDLKWIGGDLFTSDYLVSVWGRGMISIGQVSLESCNYVARYAIKKNNTDCCIRMSYGFGKNYFLDHMDDIMSNGFVTLPKNGKIMKCAIPRYFMKIYRKVVGDKTYAKWLKHRIKAIDSFKSSVEFTYRTAVDKFDYLTRRRLGIRSIAEKLHQKSKDLINESYYEFCNNRDII